MAFRLNFKGDLIYLTIPSFEETGLVKHGFSTRQGGVSRPPYQSLNLGLKKEDDRASVIENYKISVPLWVSSLKISWRQTKFMKTTSM